MLVGRGVTAAAGRRPAGAALWRHACRSASTAERGGEETRAERVQRLLASGAHSPVFRTDPERKDMIDTIIRVDHAGEAGAIRIYDGQLAVLRGTDVEETIQDMRDGEVTHLVNMNYLLRERRTRPTVLLPLWDVAGFALGAGTALLGKEAAMACTVAVEEVITEHYNDQLRELAARREDDDELRTIIRQHRDDEEEHCNTGIRHNAEQAPFHDALTAAIKMGCRVAIALSSRV